MANRELKGSKGMQIKKILICGLGSIGKKYVRLLSNYWPSIEIAALRSGHSKSEQKKSDLLEFYHLDNALNWLPDAAIISNPAPYHLEYSIALAREEIPLLIEKPLGCSYLPLSQWDELIRISNTTKILVGYVFRHDSAARFLKSSLEEKMIGKIIHANFYCGSWLPDWRVHSDYRDSVSATKSLGGGVLLELSHEIDLAAWLFSKLEIKHISTNQSGLLEVDVEDQACLTGNCGDGILTTISLDFCSRPPSRHAIFRGSKGELKLDLLKRKVYLSSEKYSHKLIHTAPNLENSYLAQLFHFFDCIIADVKPLCTVQDGIDVLKIISKEPNKNHQSIQ